MGGELVGYVDVGRLNNWKGIGGEHGEHMDAATFEASRQLASKIAKKSGIDLARIDICTYGDEIRKSGLVHDLGSPVFLSELSLLTTDSWSFVNRGYSSLYKIAFPALKYYWTSAVTAIATKMPVTLRT